MDAALARIGGRTLPDGLCLHGWTVRASKAPIIGDAQIEQYSAALGGVLTLPEILFGNSALRLTHDASGVALEFSALDALKAWKAEALPPLKVGVAREWQAARQEEIERQNAVVLDYDWTYTTPYAGSVVVAEVGAATEAAVDDGGGGVTAAGNGDSGTESTSGGGCAALDNGATGCSTSNGALNGGGDAVATRAPFAPPPPRAPCVPPAPPRPPPSSSHGTQQQLPEWRPTAASIDRGMLMQRHEPILFYADVPLYESELDDSGACTLSAKVRVMPRCWFVLLRFFLRVDGACVRLREARLFCRLDGGGGDGVLLAGAARVVREITHYEATMDELRAAGAHAAGGAALDGDAAAATFGAVAPACVRRHELSELVLLPVVVGAEAAAGGAEAAAAAAAESS